MTATMLSKADLARDLARLDAARGVIIAALQAPTPAPEALATARRRAIGHVRALVTEERAKEDAT